MLGGAGDEKMAIRGVVPTRDFGVVSTVLSYTVRMAMRLSDKQAIFELSIYEENGKTKRSLPRGSNARTPPENHGATGGIYRFGESQTNVDAPKHTSASMGRLQSQVFISDSPFLSTLGSNRSFPFPNRMGRLSTIWLVALHSQTNGDVSEHAEGIVETYPPHPAALWPFLPSIVFLRDEVNSSPPRAISAGRDIPIRRVSHSRPDNNESQLVTDIDRRSRIYGN